MKSIINYISEAIEIEKTDDWHRTVTLVTRDNIDCSALSKDEYVQMMVEDLKEADKLYREENKQYDKDLYERELAWQKKKFTEYAEKKWKTDKKRQQYISNAMQNLKLQPKESKITYVDIDSVHPGPMSFKPRVYFDNLVENVKKSYDDIKNSDIFNEATGWKIKYITTNDSMKMSFWPYVYFIVSDSKRKELEDEEKRLTDSIKDFYKDTKYWGD